MCFEVVGSTIDYLRFYYLCSKLVYRMSLTTNCKSEKGCKIPLNLCSSVNETAVIECLQETKVNFYFFKIIIINFDYNFIRY